MTSALLTRPSGAGAARPIPLTVSKPSVRRHDLDALRAIAMLLGIVLHAALSFTSVPWPVHDTQPGEIYHVLFACVHGFRMPLFFLLSGFFTAMLWRKRGLVSLVKHRCKRILLPLFFGCVTIVPVMWVVSGFVSQPATDQETSTIFSAVVEGDVVRLRSELQRAEVEGSGMDVNAFDAASGSSPLCTAVFLGHTEIVEMLIDAKADVNLPNRDKARPLHIAVFMARPEEAALLLQAGADANGLDGTGATPGDLLNTDFGTTAFVAGSLGVQLDEESVLKGREKIADLLGEAEYLGSDAGASGSMQGLMSLLFYLPAFMHLWFLWFLCWFVVAFLIYAWIARAVGIERLPKWIVCSPFSLLWLIPITMVPQAFMEPGSFGPDASVGLLPLPSVLIYYAIFFFFGALYWEMDDSQGQLGSWWKAGLPFALLFVFPIGFDLMTGSFGIVPMLESESTAAWAGNFLEAAFAWLMAFGSIGLCRNLLSGESKAMRYLSDSSYWLYLVHLPLVILAQWFVRDLPVPACLKFAGITIVVSGLLLVTYQYGVRYTLIGHLLNGPRTRPSQAV
ncbi:MAG: acyltransferase family protein [Planctomycetota bacterium]